MKLLISGARVIDPASNFDQIADVLLDEGRVAAIHTTADATVDASVTRLDAAGKWLFPGLVDLAAWLREPGLDHKATLASECRAAVASGITTLCYQPEPANSIDNSAAVNLIRDLSAAVDLARVEVIGNMTAKLEGKKLCNIGGLKRVGCVGVTNSWQPFESLNVMRRAMEYAATHDLTVFIYPLEQGLAAGGFMHEGEVSTRLGLPAIPAAAETVAVAQTLALMELTGTRVHFCRLSTAGSVRLIRQAKRDGLAVSADVAAHQLFFTQADVAEFHPVFHLRPPLRAESDRQALLEGLKDDTIDAICSDHQPHEIDAKLAPFQQTEPGISALESLLPLSLKLVEQGVLSLAQALRKVSTTPAQLITQASGQLSVGAPADLVLFEPQKAWTWHCDAMLSQGKNSPLGGWSFQGQVAATWVAGRAVYASAALQAAQPAVFSSFHQLGNV